MSHGPPPPAGQFFGFPNLLDMGSQDGADVMALLDSSMFASFDDMPLTMDPADGGAFGSDADRGNPTDESIARAENQFNTAANNVPGAGPVPPGAFSQMSLSGGNTLTEFTKRRNWPAKVVEELRDFLHILDANGRIKYASPSVLSVAGYATDEIADVFLKELIHPDDQGVFVSELNNQ